MTMFLFSAAALDLSSGGVPPSENAPNHLPVLLDLENFPLQPVPFGKKLLAPLPPVPGPPPQPLSERDSRRRRASSRCLLKVVALMAVPILEESPIEVIVQPVPRSSGSHQSLLIYLYLQQ
jgi:hypothetical protein